MFRGYCRSKKKSGASEPFAPINWAYLFDLLSHEYGWTSRQILELTLTEFYWRLGAINKRNDYNFRVDAALAGKEVKAQIDDSSNELTEKQQKLLSKEIEGHGNKLRNTY